MASRPSIVVIAGPNGAGKSTIAKPVLADTLGIEHFVNADVIAQGLSGFAPQRASFTAGRLMLQRLHELANSGASFAFESTLASRSFAPWIRGLTARGYRFHVAYVWVRSASLALRRVRNRVQAGGHDVPKDVVLRRYSRSLVNLIRLYLPLAHSWAIYDNSDHGPARLIAHRAEAAPKMILVQSAWARILRDAHADESEDDTLD